MKHKCTEKILSLLKRFMRFLTNIKKISQLAELLAAVIIYFITNKNIPLNFEV